MGLVDEYGFPISTSYAETNVTKETLKLAIMKILSFYYYKVDILSEDMLNILIDTECISTNDMKKIIEEYKQTKKHPSLPTPWIDYSDRLKK